MDFNCNIKVLACLMLWLLNLTSCRATSELVKNMDGSFFMTEKLKETYKHLIITDRSEDRYLRWMDGHDGQLNSNVTSTCPWAYRQVWNPTRIPETFIEAVCLNERCLNVSDLFSTEDLPEPGFAENTKCSKVEYARWVKVKRHGKQGKITYRRRLLMINVGCTCNQDRVQQSL